MTNIIFLFGTFAGIVVIGAMIAVIVASSGHPEFGSHSLLLGYLIQLVALSMIFFGVKRYRDQELGGVIKFVPAFLVGIAIAAVAGVIYVLVWEVYLAATHFTVIDAMANAMVESARAKGATGDALNAAIKEAEDFKVQYSNPLVRLPLTFVEIVPVSLVISLISAALLRNPKVLPATA